MAAFYFTVTGAKDGVGKSIFCANLAVSIFKESGARVAIFDLDSSCCGDIANIFGLRESITIAELSEVVKKGDPKQIFQSITRHQIGIHLFSLYKNRSELATLSPDEISTVLKAINQMFNFVLIDGGSSFDQFTVKAYEYSSLVFFISTSEVLALLQAERKLSDLRTLQLPGNMVMLILNQFDPRGMISKGVVQKKLGKDVLLAIPFDPQTVINSINDANPFVISQPKSPLTRCFDELSHYLLQGSTLKSLTVPASGNAIGHELLKRLNPLLSGQSAGGGRSISSDLLTKRVDKHYERNIEIRKKIHQKLIEVMDLKAFKPEEEAKMDPKKLEELKTQTSKTIDQLLESEVGDYVAVDDRRKIAKEIFDEALGLGPIEDLLADPNISEIMVNRRDQIYVEMGGKLKLTSSQFTSDKNLMTAIERIVAPIGRRIDEKTPMVDARLRDGSRVNAIISPLAIDGPMVTIRKFAKEKITYKTLVKYGTLTEEMADFLRACIEARLNTLVSGGTGSGKTTLLNVLGSFIPTDERIVTIEDSAELQLPQEHVGRLETRPPTLQGENEITIRDLVKNALRMRPDRIIVGECRGAEALDMLQAMNTGHDGSLTTIHSNTPRDCIQRLETLVMFAGYDLPSKAIREQIGSAIHMIVQLSRFSDGSRKITHLTEVAGMEAQTVILQDIFVYKQTGTNEQGRVEGYYSATGLIPKFVETLKDKGIRIPKGLFSEKKV